MINCSSLKKFLVKRYYYLDNVYNDNGETIEDYRKSNSERIISLHIVDDKYVSEIVVTDVDFKKEKVSQNVKRYKDLAVFIKENF